MNYVISSGLQIDIAGEVFTVFSERALYWERKATLMIADIHLGKGDIFRAAGIAVPHSLQVQDISRLEVLLLHLQPTTLIILGDIVHGKWIADATMTCWQALRSRHGNTKFILTQGNHDKNIQSVPRLVDETMGHIIIDDILLSHDPWINFGGRLSIGGHVHPVFRSNSWQRSFPAMVLDGRNLRLPAFSEFTAGVQIHSLQSEVWVFVDHKEVIQVQ